MNDTAQESVDAEIIPESPMLPAVQTNAYAGASTLVMQEAEAVKLGAMFDLDDYDILPTGEVYVPQVSYRRRLNDVAGPGQWCLIPMSPWARQGNTICREYALHIRGHFV